MLLSSWISVPETSEFSLQNLPYGVFSPKGRTDRRCGTIVGETVLDLSILEEAGLFDDVAPPGIFRGKLLNPFLECRPGVWRSVRKRLVALLEEKGGDARLRNDGRLQSVAFHSLEGVKLHLPIQVGDYTDFYSSREHATNVGIMFRGKDNALQPNWLHLPVGYHGRSSTIQVSGHSFPRPMGQLQKNPDDPMEGSVLGPSELLDFELEIAAVVGGPPNEGPMDIAQAKERIFGYMLMNDWSARDIQKWEYVPLGPFTSKNFATTVAPWIVPAEALEAFRVPTSAGTQDNPEPLPYLKDPEYSSYDIQLKVAIQPEKASESHVISRSNFVHLYWNPPQQLVHHSVTGCVMNAGDMLGSGTISGTDPISFGSMLELSWKGTKEIPVGNEVRKFLHDGDTVTMRGCCEKDGWGRVGFGECRATVLPPTRQPRVGSTEDFALTRYRNFKLYGFCQSSSTWRVRMVLGYKNIPYETISVDLTKKENQSESHKRLNALGQVPILECFDAEMEKPITLTQSLAIVEFLEDAVPGRKSIYPRDLTQRGKVKEIVEIVNSGIQPLQNKAYLKRLELSSNGAISAAQEAHDVIERGLRTLETLVQEQQSKFGGPFCAGTFSPTLADFCVIPQLANARRFDVEVGSVCPTLVSAESMSKSSEWYKSSSPQAQPDYKG
uniref:fumarylacetoacetase n=1 Tax=Amphora coffeiformis TaxID=265554 RepID=A0A7S3LBJ4_9STRA|mmetsp:Transcript_4376/g.8345  ORF Transcript_4376/g.8345 Transcript_4376/m.8345 type:complete len:667 (+) Transcript_4376:145-2145(+)|eukprot:scaffold18052_cov175-Amphora_coffeaeformis.AAC.15